MREMKIKIYNFNELSEKAQRKAIREVKEDIVDAGFYDDSDLMDSIEKISKSINCYYNFSDFGRLYFITKKVFTKMSGKRAYAYIFNNYILPNMENKTYYKDHVIYCDGRKNWARKSNIFVEFGCPFTGYYADYCLFDAWKDFNKKFNSKSSVYDFIDLVSKRLNDEIEADRRYKESDEYIIDFIDANEIEFRENGSMFLG